MSPPAIEEVSQEVYDALGPWREEDPAHGYQLMLYVDAHARELQPLEDLVRVSDDGPGWSLLLDVDRCPVEYLDHLGQYVGTVTEPQQTDAEKRAIIKTVPGWARGRPATLKAIVAASLTGTRMVTFLERFGGDAYALRVRTYAAETPFRSYDDALAGFGTYDIEAAAYPTYASVPNAESEIRTALGLAKPGGLILTYEVLAGSSYDDLTAQYGTYNAEAAALTTYDAAINHVPGS